MCPGRPCRVLLRFSIFRKMLIMHIHVSFAYGIRKFKDDTVNSLLHFLGNKCPLQCLFFLLKVINEHILFFFNFCWSIYVIYNVVLLSAVQQSV